MQSDSPAHNASHNQSVVDTTGGMLFQAIQVHAADESIPADGEGYSTSLKTFSLNPYTDKEILVSLGQLVNVKHALCDIEKQHRDQLPPSF